MEDNTNNITANNMDNNTIKISQYGVDVIPTVGNRRYTGVGTLIITMVDGKPALLLGRESYKSIKHRGSYMVSIFEEFGGGIQRRRVSLEENACYELREETSNLLDFTKYPEILKGNARYFDLPFRDDRIYRLYVIYIEDVNNIIPYLQVNRKIINKSLNIPQSGAKNKIKTFLEMDTIKLVPLSNIQTAMNDINNYICFKAEDTIWNLNHKEPPYRGILKVDSDTFINERLVQFLSGYHSISNTTETISNAYHNIENLYDKVNSNIGIDICFDIINKKEKIIKLDKPVKVQNNYYRFLNGTFTFPVSG